MDTKDTKITSLAFKELSDNAQKILYRKGIERAGQLLRWSDSELSLMGITKTDMVRIDRSLRALGLKRSLKGSAATSRVVGTVKLGMGSSLAYGGNILRIGNLVEAQKFRFLRHLYYNVADVDFNDEVANAIGLEFRIEKPGTDPMMERLQNEKKDNNLHGMVKLKLKTAMSRQMREENRAYLRSATRDLTKGNLQATNLRRSNIKTDFVYDPYDYRPYAEWIRGSGYSRPRANDAKTVEALRNLYRNIRRGTKKTVVSQGEEYLANLTFLNYVEEACPDHMEEAAQMCFTDFRHKDYFGILDGLGLGDKSVGILLNSRTKTLREVVIRDPFSGRAVYVNNITIENNIDKDGCPKMTFFNEDTYDRFSPEKFFISVTENPPKTLSELTEESSAINVDDLMRIVGRTVDDDKVLCTDKEYAGRGRYPMTFEVKLKDGYPYVKAVERGKDNSFVRMDSFILEDTYRVLNLVEQLKDTERITFREF